MRKNIEGFNDIYNENLDKIPLDDLGKMVYNQHIKYLEGFNIEGSDAEKLFKPILDIMKGVEFRKRAFLFSQLYMSTLIFLFKDHEASMKYSKANHLSHIITVLTDIETTKAIYDMLEAVKQGGKLEKINMNKVLERINKVQELLEMIIKREGDIIKGHEDELQTLCDVLNGEKEVIELYRSKDELEYLKNASENLYNIYVNKIYQAENYKNPFKNDEYVKALVEDVLSGVFFMKEDRYYDIPGSETSKYLKKLEVEGD
jgi:hypothetical protein